MQMERVREMSYEAETKREEKQFLREYRSMFKMIAPYLNGTKPYAVQP
jgi:hypothetical protein